MDRLVAEAYVWPWPEPPSRILERLVALHAVRVEEERAGRVCWLRPEYQRARFGKGAEAVTDAPARDAPAGNAASTPTQKEAPEAQVPWPADAVGQITALRTLAAVSPLSVEQAVRCFSGAKRDLVARHLETLCILGEVQDVGGGRYAVASGSY